MDHYTFDDVPALLGQIAATLGSIDSKLYKPRFEPRSKKLEPDMMTLEELCEYLPTHPAKSTVYDWTAQNTIPYYKHGKYLVFNKSEIDTWLERGHHRTDEELEEIAQEYVANHPLGGWGRRR